MSRLTPIGLALLLVACTGDSGDGDGDGDGGGSSIALGPLLTIDEALAIDTMTAFVSAVPTCDLTGGAAAGPPPPPAGVSSDGACGGSLDVEYDHSDGDTVYTLNFSQFCMSSDTGNVVLDGIVVGEEDGTPSDYGPVVEALSFRTEGALAVAQDSGPDLEVTLTGHETVYGVPAEWQPGVPTVDAPDITTIERISFVPVEGDYDPIHVADLRVERTGATPTLTITDGAVVLGDVGHVTLTTSAPVTLDVTNPGGGARLDWAGADGTTAAGVTVAGSPGVLAVEVNGVTMTEGLDCAPAIPLFAQAAGALWQALPLY